MKIASIHIAIAALAIAAILPGVCAVGDNGRHNHLRNAPSDNASTQHLRFLGDGSSCSPEGEKSTDCGAQPRDDRAEMCCPGLKCGGEKGEYCVKTDDGVDDESGTGSFRRVCLSKTVELVIQNTRSWASEDRSPNAKSIPVDWVTCCWRWA